MAMFLVKHKKKKKYVTKFKKKDENTWRKVVSGCNNTISDGKKKK